MYTSEKIYVVERFSIDDETEKEIVAVSYDEDCAKEYATLHNRLDGIGWFCKVKPVDVLTKNYCTQQILV